MSLGFLKRKLNRNPNESENPLDFGFAKNWENPTTFGFGFQLRHIHTTDYYSQSRDMTERHKIFSCWIWTSTCKPEQIQWATVSAAVTARLFNTQLICTTSQYSDATSNINWLAIWPVLQSDSEETETWYVVLRALAVFWADLLYTPTKLQDHSTT